MAQDDEAARFEALYRENYLSILITCVHRLGDRCAAEDATAEVFRVAWQQFLTKKDNPTRAWLYIVARDVIGHEYRRKARYLALLARLEETPRVTPTEQTAEVREALGQLRKKDRELLYLAYWEGLSRTEIARILRISSTAVWARLRRARAAIRQMMVP